MSSPQFEPLRVAFRVDSGTMIGSGHVMRCLTLADEIVDRGGEVLFVSRRHDGNRNLLVHRRGFPVFELPGIEPITRDQGTWLGGAVAADADATADVLASLGSVDWLVVDHYAIDATWESRLRASAKRILVIDDLADRRHDCHVLTDPLPGEPAMLRGRYTDLSPGSTLLLGPRFAILRPEFKEAAAGVPPRHFVDGDPLRIHVYFGSVGEKPWLRYAWRLLDMPHEFQVTIVAPDADDRDIEDLSRAFPNRVEVLRAPASIAATLSQCDIAFGAPGTTTWERACLGLPSAYLATTPMQHEPLAHLESAGLCSVLGNLKTSEADVLSRFERFVAAKHALTAQSQQARESVDGFGAQRIVDSMWK